MRDMWHVGGREEGGGCDRCVLSTTEYRLDANVTSYRTVLAASAVLAGILRATAELIFLSVFAVLILLVASAKLSKRMRRA